MGLFIHARRLFIGRKCPSKLMQIRGIFPASLGLFAIWSPCLPHIVLTQRGPTGSSLCRLFNRPGGPLADRSCRPCEGGWLLLWQNLQKKINQTVNDYSLRRIAEIDCAPSGGADPSRFRSFCWGERSGTRHGLIPTL
jgi:hypothetical protein